ncbi:uncharacterized protein LOC110825936 [Carica papaya]|uniref:uncharacterized protein LOC110825936 n=1 Tax=Carica papaya TaxID=3649 RepID=UPI000B8CA699|nr:uncharacterized protein LOC110825936 [Carica papaya]
MAAYHARSHSFPCITHPFLQQVDVQLCRIKSSVSASTLSTSVCGKISALQDLYECVEKLLLLPLCQQTLTRELNEEGVAELLDGSLRLLDVCSSAKDVLLLTKESTRELQSSFRRRCGGEAEIKKYLASRKLVKKAIHKALRKLKGIEKSRTSSPINLDKEASAMLSMLREAEAVTATALESLLSLISGSNLQTKPSSWSLVSKLIHHKRVAPEEEFSDNNEFANMDSALQSLCSPKTSKCGYSMLIQSIQAQLKNLEQCIQDLEDGLECLSRRLIKTRVSFLNILNH